MKLLTKYTLVIGGVLLLTMVCYAVLNVHSLKDMLLGEAVRDVDNLSETLVQTTHYQMLEDDRKRVYQMMEEVGTQQGIEHIRLINKDGVIRFSTESAEIGTLIDKNAEACTMCHSDDTPLTHASSMNRSRKFHDRSGKDVLGLAKGIYNEPVCSTADCHFHSPDQKLLGVLDVIVSLEGMQTQAFSYTVDIAALTFILLLVLFLALMLLNEYLINDPLSSLVLHVGRLSRGELDSRIENMPQDEFGELELAVNQMAQNLERAQNELRDLAQNLELKVEERTREIRTIQARLMHSEKLASLGELVAGIAHEINNPLTSILMFSSLVLEHTRLEPALKGDMETVLRETQRCADIVRRLLEFSRESPPKMSHDSLNWIMERTLALVERQELFHNIRIHRNYDDDLPPLMLDGNQIKQVFINILLNASQAMEGSGELTVASGRLGRMVFMRVSDTGPGIPEAIVEKIFDPFFTTKEHRGTGLGLSVSFGIVENHGGKIEVESRLGEGASFTVLLPLAAEAEASAA